MSFDFGFSRMPLMRFAKIVFLVAGIYGLLVMLPQYFFEGKMRRDSPPPITHPEFYYGFIGVTVAWQILFLVISRNPARYSAMMIPAILEKAGFLIAIIILFFEHGVTPMMLAPAAIDMLLAFCLSRRFSRRARCGMQIEIQDNIESAV